MEKSLYSRNFEVNYYEVEDNIWRAISHLKDHQHDIQVIVDVSVPGVIYNYFPHQIKIGNMTEKQWWDFCKEKLPKACIAHTIMSNNA